MKSVHYNHDINLWYVCLWWNSIRGTIYKLQIMCLTLGGSSYRNSNSQPFAWLYWEARAGWLRRISSREVAASDQCTNLSEALIQSTDGKHSRALSPLPASNLNQLNRHLQRGRVVWWSWVFQLHEQTYRIIQDHFCDHIISDDGKNLGIYHSRPIPGVLM